MRSPAPRRPRGPRLPIFLLDVLASLCQPRSLTPSLCNETTHAQTLTAAGILHCGANGCAHRKQGMFFEGPSGQHMTASYRGTRPRAVDAKGPKKSPFFPLHTPPVWPFCAADGTIRTALALPLREASSFSSEPPQARTATRSLARTTHLPDLPARCWHMLPHPHTITSAAPLALTYLNIRSSRCRTGP